MVQVLQHLLVHALDVLQEPVVHYHLLQLVFLVPLVPILLLIGPCVLFAILVSMVPFLLVLFVYL